MAGSCSAGGSGRLDASGFPDAHLTSGTCEAVTARSRMRNAQADSRTACHRRRDRFAGDGHPAGQPQRRPSAPPCRMGIRCGYGGRIGDGAAAQRLPLSVRRRSGCAARRPLSVLRRHPDGRQRIGRSPRAQGEAPDRTAFSCMGRGSRDAADDGRRRDGGLRHHHRLAALRRVLCDRGAHRDRPASLLATAAERAHALVVRAHDEHARRVHCRGHGVPRHQRGKHRPGESFTHRVAHTDDRRGSHHGRMGPVYARRFAARPVTLPASKTDTSRSAPAAVPYMPSRTG